MKDAELRTDGFIRSLYTTYIGDWVNYPYPKGIGVLRHSYKYHPGIISAGTFRISDRRLYCPASGQKTNTMSLAIYTGADSGDWSKANMMVISLTALSGIALCLANRYSKGQN